MKIKVYITSLLFFLVGMKINAQNEIHVDTISFCYFNGFTKQAQNINEIQVTNNFQYLKSIKYFQFQMCKITGRNILPP